ncbi:MAG: 2-dehydropantoate 2-reductase [Rhodospirillaceae bacterium]|jgi:2-dehydropantoate 2-reductase|nr:2-dehydropantoate 2-reductase [Rhodospirillaceae bacterium]MBT4488604.1 2-dehydropantoate 2-reductase [Rhodospirillaceae bacterium]MBT5195015.1 2-dehydropantoate 2-reductase [Rhodospirillaceae bacterium]MBT6429120.1 2-dehydropantoate 2-reductase [Rhodospirillaceae bacterium]
MTIPKICIYGAGAIGGHIGGYLARGVGAEVSLIARGPHLEAMQRHGIRIVTADDDFTVPVRATDNPGELGPQDYLFITLKSHQVDGALDAMAPLLGPQTAVIPPTTGIPWWYFHGLTGPHADRRLPELDPGDRQWSMIGPERVLGCAFWTGAEVTEPGVIHQDGTRAAYPIGEPSGETSPRLAALVEAMTAGGLNAPIQKDIRGQIWIKMINSLCWNQAAFLTEAINGQFSEAPEAVDVIRGMMAEMEAIATELGAEMAVPMEKRIAMTVGARDHTMSMLQDLQRGRPIEIDVLADSVAAMSRIAGITAPTVEALTALTKLKGRVRGVYNG